MIIDCISMIIARKNPTVQLEMLWPLERRLELYFEIQDKLCEIYKKQMGFKNRGIKVTL